MDWVTVIQIGVTAIVTIIGQNFFTEWMKRSEKNKSDKDKRENITNEKIRTELWDKVKLLETEVNGWRTKHEEASLRNQQLETELKNLREEYKELEQRFISFQAFSQEYMKIGKEANIQPADKEKD